MIKSIIIEDERVSYEILNKMIETNFEDINVVGYADTCSLGISLIKYHKPDLVFLDIELEDGSGFKVLEAFKELPFQVVFVTAHNQFAINAIKWSALDYIIKPVITNDLVEVIKKFKKNVGRNDDIKHQALIENIKDKSNSPRKIIISTLTEHYMVEPDDIVRCQSDNYYTIIYFQNGEKVMVSKTLKEYEILLQDSGFIRVHNSHLVNSKYIKSFVRPEGGYLVMKDNKIIPVSRRKKPILFETMTIN